MQKLLYPQCGDTSLYRGCCTLSVVGGLCAAPSPGKKQLANEAEGQARKTVLWSGGLRTALQLLRRLADKPRRQKQNPEMRRRSVLPASPVEGRGLKENYQTLDPKGFCGKVQWSVVLP